MALDNKLNITDSTELARMEEKISKKKAVELFENRYLDNYEAGTFMTSQGRYEREISQRGILDLHR